MSEDGSVSFVLRSGSFFELDLFFISAPPLFFFFFLLSWHVKYPDNMSYVVCEAGLLR